MRTAPHLSADVAVRTDLVVPVVMEEALGQHATPMRTMRTRVPRRRGETLTAGEAPSQLGKRRPTCHPRGHEDPEPE